MASSPSKLRSYYCAACNHTVWVSPNSHCSYCNSTDLVARKCTRTPEEVFIEQRRAFDADQKPAPRSSIENMEKFTITEESVKTQPECSFCLTEFKIGTIASIMKCGHFYHDHCVIPWLEQKNACPLCKANLPRREIIPYPTFDSQGGGSSSSSSHV